MLLTPEQEQQLIEENMPKIYRAVDNFMGRCSAQVIRIPYEDFVQETSIVFLKHIRKCETPEDTAKFPWYDAMCAMRNLVALCQPMKARNVSQNFSEIIHNMPKTVSLDDILANTGAEVNGMSKHWVDDKDTQMDFDIFMDNQSENTRRIASMRVYGMTLREIGAQCGVTAVAIKKRLDRLNEDYKSFMEDDENAG